MTRRTFVIQARSPVWLGVLALLVAALLVAQYIWLAQLGALARGRMERDLRLAATRAAETLEFEPDLAVLTDSVLPALAARLAQELDFEVTIALLRRGAGIEDSLVYASGPVPSRPPDARATFFGAASRFQPPRAAADTARLRRDPSVSWVGEGGGGDAARLRGWEMVAWHGGGSLERAVARLRLRNLAVGFGLTLLLAATGATLLNAARRDERLAIERSAILAGISHELRTPLAVIRSAADNLAGGTVTGPAAVAEYGVLLTREADRLIDTVEQALALARGAGDPALWRRTPVDLVPLAREVCDAFRDGHRVIIRVPSAARCLGDTEALRAVVRNVVANALAYSPGSAAVTLTIAEEGPAIVLRVDDEGPGIPAAERARLFEPFVRGVAGHASGHHGAGLGLALVHRVVRDLGGRVRMADRSPHGTAVTVELPPAR